MIKLLKFALPLCLLPFGTHAMSVNSMQLIGDAAGNGVFTLTNDQPYTEYITAEIVEINVDNNNIERILYDENNVVDWDITLTHPKLILESGRSKEVGVRSLCGQECNFDRDHVYQIKFIPSVYTGEETKDDAAVSLLIGYAPLYIIPAAKPTTDYILNYDGKSITAENNGNSFYYLQVDQCSVPGVKEKGEGCRTHFTVLAGRKKVYEIPEAMRQDRLNVTISNHDSSYSRRLKLDKE